VNKSPTQNQMNRRNILITGLIGLVGAVFLTALCLFVMANEWLPVLIDDTSLAWGIFLFLTFFSVAEIPLMVYGIRRIGESAQASARYIALVATAGYCFFGAIYAAPFILLTGGLTLGAVLASLSFARFVSAVVFIPR